MSGRKDLNRIRSVTAVTVTAVLILAACTGSQQDRGTGASGADGPTLNGAGTPDPDATPIRRVTEPVGDWLESSCALPIELLRRQRAGINQRRSPDLTVVPREPNYFGAFSAFTHSGPWDYLQEVPVALYGPGFIKSQGDLNPARRTTVADLAPTLSNLLEVDFPKDRPARALTGALVPQPRRPGKPKVIVQIVWDGGGWNVLNQWPNAWPTLRRIMEKGTSVTGVEVGSSPSVTPAVHATIGTGTFPNRHAVVDIRMREGTGITGAWAGKTPDNLEETTVADIYDQQVGNAAKIGMFSYKSWHWGLLGHGAYLAGGDRDIAVVSDLAGHLTTNEQWFKAPNYVNDVPKFEKYIEQVDIDDGQADGLWMEHDVLSEPPDLRDSPVWVLYQTDIMKTIMTREGFGADDITDLFFINYKQLDDIGHDYNMLEPETREIVSYADTELAKTIRWLNAKIGRRNWVVMVTADHGQGPDPLRYGTWPIHRGPLYEDIAETFGVEPEELFQDERPGAFWVDQDVMDEAGLTLEKLANFFIDYRLEDNVSEGEEIPQPYKDRLREPIFAAAFPTSEVGRVWRCATKP